MVKIDIPEGEVEFVSKEIAYWQEIREKTKQEIERLNKLLKFNLAILEMAEDKIEEEEKLAEMRGD